MTVSYDRTLRVFSKDLLPYWRLGIDARKVQQPLVQITLSIGQIPGPPTDFSREHHMETPETKIYFLN